METKELYEKLVTVLIKKGKKQKAEKQLNKFLMNVAKIKKKNPIESIIQILNQVKPTLKLRPIRKSGQQLHIPRPLEKKKQQKVAISWYIIESRKIKQKEISKAITIELIKVEKKESNLLKKKENIYKIAVSNRGSLFIIK